MKSKLLGLMGVIALLGFFPSPGYASTLDFAFSFTCTNCMNVSPFGGTVTGEIDGLTAGTTSAASHVIIDSYPSAFTAPSPLPYDTITTCGSNCTVSENAFTVDAGGNITAYHFTVGLNAITGAWAFGLGSTACSGSFCPIDFLTNNADTIGIDMCVEHNCGSTTFTEISAPTTTPLPAALPLFATGLSAFGLFGWHRKRKNYAASRSRLLETPDPISKVPLRGGLSV